jgi:WD40 repeat protein
MKNGFCVFTINASHMSSINCIELLPNDVLVSVSSDRSIRLTDLKSGQCLNTLHGHTGEINFVLNLEKRSFKFLNNIFN